MNFLIVAPVLLPLCTAAITALLLKKPTLQRIVSLIGAALSVAGVVALVCLVQRHDSVQLVFGAWKLPYGISFVIDRLSALMLLITAVMGFVSLVYLASDVDADKPNATQIPLIHGLLAGVGGAFATADLFNLYVWFEVMLICSLGLLSGGGKKHHLDGAFKYMTLNMFATLMLLAGIVMVYGLTGHLSFSGIQQSWAQVDPTVGIPVLALLCLALLAKAGAFPFYAWLPPSYPTLSAPVLALFAGLLTKVGTYAILRMLGGVFSGVPLDWFNAALGWFACFTMVLGVLGAAYHWDMRRILALHIISQIGYIMLAIALGSEQGYAASLFYTVHNILAKASLFLVAGIIAKRTGSYDLRRIGGLYAVHPTLALLFGISALALVGIPPFSGFWAKFLILRETNVQSQYVWLAVALMVSVMTMYSMMKIWMEAFWKAHPTGPESSPLVVLPAKNISPALLASLILTILIVFISLYPQPLMVYAEAAAQTLVQP